jgi:hypothetical protein
MLGQSFTSSSPTLPAAKAWVKPDGVNPPGIDERGNGISHGDDIVAFEAQN